MRSRIEFTRTNGEAIAIGDEGRVISAAPGEPETRVQVREALLAATILSNSLPCACTTDQQCCFAYAAGIILALRLGRWVNDAPATIQCAQIAFNNMPSVGLLLHQFERIENVVEHVEQRA
eukprot:SAG11_NODE_5629_length_1503_cov_1.120370_3_plen_121_part_00